MADNRIKGKSLRRSEIHLFGGLRNNYYLPFLTTCFLEREVIRNILQGVGGEIHADFNHSANHQVIIIAEIGIRMIIS